MVQNKSDGAAAAKGARSTELQNPGGTADLSAELMRLINAFQVSQALHVGATLGVADQLKYGSRLSDALARACGVEFRAFLPVATHACRGRHLP